MQNLAETPRPFKEDDLTEEQMKEALEKIGFRFVKQKPGEEFVEVDGQRVKMPSVSCDCEVALRREGDKWVPVGGAEKGRLFNEELKLLHSIYVEGAEKEQ